MRILFFSTAFPQPHEPSRNPDNLERCLALADDHDVHVISPLSWRPARTRETWARPRLSVSRPVQLYPPGVLRGTHAWCMWQCIRHSVARTLATFRPDGVIAYWTYPDGAVALRIARMAGVPCVAIVGGSDVLAIDATRPRDARARRAIDVLRGVDAIAAVSASLQAHVVSLGIPADKIHVLPPAVDKRTFFPGSRAHARSAIGAPAEAPMIVWVGRMVEVKALDVLLDAIAAIAPAFTALRVYLIGDGPLRRTLEQQVAARGLTEHVIFAGRVPHRDLPRYYRAADVTVLPSHWEGMPNVLLESHACGTPFVASRVGAIPELAMGEVDELVTPGDHVQLAAALAISLRRTRSQSVTCTAGGWDQNAAQLVHLLATASIERVRTSWSIDASFSSNSTSCVPR
jgi:teichuronic acid biosynthesis glycosyltransferase TuaC